MAVDRSGLVEVATEIVLYDGSVPATPLGELIPAAAAAGFDAISLWPLVYRRALSREGMTTADIRARLDDHGIRVTEVDGLGDFVPGIRDGTGPFKALWTRHQYFAAAAEVGADTIVAAHLTGGPVPHDVAVEGFAALCADAAEHDLRVALEPFPFSGIPDLRAGTRIVADAGCANGGLAIDTWHVIRAGTGVDVLTEVPPDRVFSVQLADGPRVAPGTSDEALSDEAAYHRQVPGDGEMGLAGMLRVLAARGVRARVGPEVYRRRWEDQTIAATAAELFAGTVRVLSAQGG